MPKATPKAWETARVPVSKILLDIENPRVEFSPQTGQKTIRRILVETQEVTELARDIVATGGWLAGERIILLKQGKEYVVLEGNRRVCACQILTDSTLAPPNYKRSFPLIDDEMHARLSILEADIAPSREAAEGIITRRHTDPGIKQWSPVAKQRRIAKLVSQGRSPDQIAAAFTMKRPDVVKTLQNFNLLEYVRRLKSWDADEERQLSDQDIQPSTFLRFFTLAGVKNALEISFDEIGGITSSLPNFAVAMELLARETLLLDPKTQKTRSTSRTPTPVIFQKAFAKHRALNRRFNSGADGVGSTDASDGQGEPEGTTSGATGENTASSGTDGSTTTNPGLDGSRGNAEVDPTDPTGRTGAATDANAADKQPSEATYAGDPPDKDDTIDQDETTHDDTDQPYQDDTTGQAGHDDPSRQDDTTGKDTDGQVDKTGKDESSAIDSDPDQVDVKGGAATKGEKPKKLDKFFESLVCPIQNNRLLQLTKEIRTIRYKDFPAAASYLLRALLESTLQWVIDDLKLRQELMKEYYSDGKAGGKKPEPSLTFIIGFLIKRQHQVFTGNVQHLLKQWQDVHKGNFDLVIHGNWNEPSAAMLEEVAKSTRIFITRVFDGTALLRAT